MVFVVVFLSCSIYIGGGVFTEDYSVSISVSSLFAKLVPSLSHSHSLFSLSIIHHPSSSSFFNSVSFNNPLPLYCPYPPHFSLTPSSNSPNISLSIFLFISLSLTFSLSLSLSLSVSLSLSLSISLSLSFYLSLSLSPSPLHALYCYPYSKLNQYRTAKITVSVVNNVGMFLYWTVNAVTTMVSCCGVLRKKYRLMFTIHLLKMIDHRNINFNYLIN